MNPIPYARQSIAEEDVAEVVRVLRSPFLTQGPEIERFEDAVKAAVGAAHAVAVSNATSALYLACRALDVGPGDVVWTTPNSFVASANCARSCGADVDFVDVDPATYQIDPAAFAAKLEAAANDGRVPKAAVVVHFAGTPCDLAPLADAARRYGVALVEDASHAIGATYRGTRVGDSAYSDMTVFSFHPVKIVTTGEGGMVVTNRQDLAERLATLRTHGITRDPARMTREPDGPWYYEQLELSGNYRMTDVQAALGAAQMRRLPAFLTRRAHLAARYAELLAGVDCTLPVLPQDRTSAWHLYAIGVDPARRRAVFERLRAHGILVNVHYIPIHLQPDFARLGFRRGDFPRAESYYARTISLPMFAELTDAEQDRVAFELRGALARAAA
ncbi:MAG TPA: UDP-4-amino-4,6-dideoxy-N-acetyl-beta-L-altrosamine transaminase [Candidatus Baltobacteraceae bacterium]|nr:UDP-4-amino-4,6-dideoxy-N-acetyl-beta-L-altrosamine transaminase [Candidatus Baltobacteraceae bacterium]